MCPLIWKMPDCWNGACRTLLAAAIPLGNRFISLSPLISSYAISFRSPFEGSTISGCLILSGGEWASVRHPLVRFGGRADEGPSAGEYLRCWLDVGGVNVHTRFRTVARFHRTDDLRIEARSQQIKEQEWNNILLSVTIGKIWKGIQQLATGGTKK